MNKKEKGITLISLVVTIIILLILSGITVGALTSQNGAIENTNKTKGIAERESLIEKIEADLYSERIKMGKAPDKNKLIEIITSKGYGTISEDKTTFISTEGRYEIELNEILGWNNN